LFVKKNIQFLEVRYITMYIFRIHNKKSYNLQEDYDMVNKDVDNKTNIKHYLK